MDYQKVIELLKKANRSNDMVFILPKSDISKVIISAMQELQELKVSDDNLNDHIQELKQAKYDIETFWEETTGLSRAMQRAINALIEVKLYKKFGTLEEVREAVEKQTAKKPIEDRHHGIRYTEVYRCPSCNGSFSGKGFAKYCFHCGKKIDWSDEE